MDRQNSIVMEKLGRERIGKLLFDYSMPAVIGMLVNTVYNIVDRIYIGQGVDPLGIAGITIVMPLMMVFMSASMLIGIGANALFSIRLGEGRRDDVEKIMGHAFALLFLVPGLVILFCFIFLDTLIVRVLGASEVVFPYAKTYLRIILYGGIFSAMGPGINHFIRSDGHPKTSMLTQIIGALLNIILDPIFIFVLDLGIAGAAWATIISQFISFVFVIAYFNSRFTVLRFRLREMKLGLRLSLRIMAIGFAPATMSLAMGLVNIILNRSLSRYGGDLAVTTMGIVGSIIMLIFMPLQGINQGVQPIIGFNYGAKQYHRVREAYWLAVKTGTIIFTAGFILLEALPYLFISIFTHEGGDLMGMCIRGLRICTAALPLIGFQMITSNYFQSVGKPVQGTILGMSRQLLIFIPLLLILPGFFGLDGVFLTMPVSDVLSVIVSIPFMRHELKFLHNANASGT
ncbi:MAG: MATE family efflux transporter [Spirochaetaceae bacterium]|jgi:putative MATE family efflux protein|nr:MATE family efflux transporter [Spirochaetaceae bacterium]